MIASGGVRPHPMRIRRMVLNELAAGPPTSPCVTLRVTVPSVSYGGDEGLPPLSSSPRCAGSYPTVPKGRGSPSRSAPRGLTIHPAARRLTWNLSKTNPPFHRRTSCVTRRPRPFSRSAAAPIPAAPKCWTPHARSTARQRANSAAIAPDMPVPDWPRAAPTRPRASELTARRTPCTSAQVVANASSASVAAPTATCSCAM
jgi:hypothetical protein